MVLGLRGWGVQGLKGSKGFRGLDYRRLGFQGLRVSKPQTLWGFMVAGGSRGRACPRRADPGQGLGLQGARRRYVRYRICRNIPETLKPKP